MERGGALDLQRGEGLTASWVWDELAAALTNAEFLIERLPNFSVTSKADEHHGIRIVLIARIEFAPASHPSARHDFSPLRYGV